VTSKRQSIYRVETVVKHQETGGQAKRTAHLPKNDKLKTYMSSGKKHPSEQSSRGNISLLQIRANKLLYSEFLTRKRACPESPL
jgi:hypothetical protein